LILGNIQFFISLFFGHFAHIGGVLFVACAFNQFQFQMHKLKPSLLVQLDHRSNAQTMGKVKAVMDNKADQSYSI
jgi:hypothetical protein